MDIYPIQPKVCLVENGEEQPVFAMFDIVGSEFYTFTHP